MRKKNKGTIECNKSTVTCDVSIIQYKDGTIKCDVLVIWYSKLPTSGTVPPKKKKKKKGKLYIYNPNFAVTNEYEWLRVTNLTYLCSGRISSLTFFKNTAYFSQKKKRTLPTHFYQIPAIFRFFNPGSSFESFLSSLWPLKQNQTFPSN